MCDGAPFVTLHNRREAFPGRRNSAAGRQGTERLPRAGGRFRTSRKLFAATLVAATMLIAAPGVYAGAQTRISLNGGRPSEWPLLASLLAGAGFTQEQWLPFASRVGENWLPGTTPVPLDYPAQLGPVSGPGALTTDQSTTVGQQSLHAAIMTELAKGEPIVVAGLSEGTLVIDKELVYLQNDPNAPPAEDITFYVFGDMGRGLGDMYLSGVTVPFFGQTFEPLPESQYDTVVVIEQWDGWANPPDRPWHLLADLNAVIGAVFTVNGINDHTKTAFDSVSNAVEVSQTTSSGGGTTTTYMIPGGPLPITMLLRQFGVPDSFVDEIDNSIMPLIQPGYSNTTPNLGPHVEHGQLVFTTPLAPAAEPTSATGRSDAAPLETGIAHADASPDAVGFLPFGAATSAKATAVTDLGSPSVHTDRQRADVVDEGRLADDAPDAGVADQPQPAGADGSDDSDSSANVHGRAKPRVTNEAKPSGTKDAKPIGTKVNRAAGGDASRHATKNTTHD